MRVLNAASIVALVVALAMAACPCGPSFPPYYVLFGNESLVLELPADALGASRVDIRGNYSPNPWEGSLDADLRQLATAIECDATDPRIQRYASARQSARKPYADRIHAERFRYYSHDTLPEAGHSAVVSVANLEDIPREFVLYLLGTRAYYREDHGTAIAWWSQVLAMPESARPYRSTWAAFMIGKAYLHIDPRSAIPFFHETRRLAMAGFPDPLDLAHASIGWEANAHDRLGAYYEAVWRYTFVGDFQSQRRSLSRALEVPEFEPRLARDPFVRQHVLAHLERNPMKLEKMHALYRDIASVAPESAVGMPGRIAHGFYIHADFDSAQSWVDIADATDPNAQWVRSKLLLRSGEVDSALNILRELAAEFPTYSAAMKDRQHVTVDAAINPLHSDVAVLLLGRNDFVDAMDVFARGGHLPDAGYIADCVLTVEELGSYLDKHAGDPALRQPARMVMWTDAKSPYDYLAHIYARRLARNGAWALAKHYYPADATSPRRTTSRTSKDAQRLTDIAERIIALDASRGTRDERAEAQIEKAILVRERGMELMGTECGPDWTLVDGQLATYLQSMYPPPRIRRSSDVRRFAREDERPSDTLRRWGGVSTDTLMLLDASELEVQRFESSRPNPDRTFHYRYVAADLMWNAAAMLPDNDPRTAEALWRGGTWLKDRDTKEADRFYKALVRRCRKLPIGQKADTMRWFPPSLEGLLQREP